MIGSVTLTACLVLIHPAQVDSAAKASAPNLSTSITPRQPVTARRTRVLQVAPPATPLTMPTDVATGRDDLIYVADGVNNRVVMLNADGSLAGEFSGIGDLALNNPIGLAIDAKDQLWITDNGNRRVVRVSADRTNAKVVDLVIQSDDKDAAPLDPTGIVVTSDTGRVFVADNDNHRILVRDNVNGAVKSVGSPGSSLGQLQWPFLVALDRKGALYVTEAIGARAQRLGPELQWTNAIGRWGISEGELYRPKGIAIDKDDRVLISDSTLGAVQAFSTRGRYLGVLTDESGGLLRFSHPMGMAIDGSGRLLVVEAGANQISVVDIPPVGGDEDRP